MSVSTSHRKNSVYGFISFVIPTLVILASYPVLINSLGVDVMGVYLLSTSLSGAWAVLDFGMFAATLKYVSEDIEKKDYKGAVDVIQTSILFYVIIGIVFAAVIIITSKMLVDLLSIDQKMHEDAVIAFNIAGIRFALFFLNMVFISVFKAFHKFEYPTLILTALSVITFGGGAIGASLFGLGLVGISLVALAGNILGITISFSICIRLMKLNGINIYRGRPNLSSFKRMLGYGMYLAINGIATSALVLVQKFLISVFLGPSAVTVYSVAGTVVNKAQAAIIAGFEFLVPWTSKVFAGRREAELKELRKLFIKSTIAAIILLVLGSLFLIAFGEILLNWWLRSVIYKEVYEVLQVLLFGLIGWSLVPTGYHLLNGIGKPALNTAFLIIYVSLLYTILFILLQDGASILDFAVSQSIALMGQGVLFILFIIAVVWKRWLR